jgi:tetratricopeptide (TPR) repeat protein
MLLVLYRSVLLWAETPGAERGTLFGGEGADDLDAPPDGVPLVEALAEAFRDLRAVRTAPGQVRPFVVSRACDAVSEWAEGEGHTGTALAWARAAAGAYPPNVAAAQRVGIMARQRADYAAAEAWLQHAGAMSRRHGDWYGFALSLNSLGNLHRIRGEFALARGHLVKALFAARRPRGRVEGGRKQLHQLEGEILHDLLTVAVYTGDFAGAERFAAEAYERMRMGHRRLPVLAHDVAGLWMERGYFARGLQVFEAVLPHMQNPEVRGRVLTNLLRAAGASGRQDIFQKHCDEARTILETLAPAETPAASWACFARGAASLGYWDAAEHAANQALKAAALRQEVNQLSEIPPLLEAIKRQRYLHAEPHFASPLEERTARTLAAGLVGSLNAMRAGE